MLSDHAYLHCRIALSTSFNGRREDYVVGLGQYASCAASTGQGLL